MASASKSKIMTVDIEKLWNVVIDYPRYPEFVEGAKKVEILSQSSNQKRVRYSIELLGKDIWYELEHLENSPREMTWSLVDSNIMKLNNGGWRLEPSADGKLEVTYSLELEFKIYVPGMVLNGLVKTSLPKLLDSFENRAKNI